MIGDRLRASPQFLKTVNLRVKTAVENREEAQCSEGVSRLNNRKWCHSSPLYHQKGAEHSQQHEYPHIIVP